MFRLSMRWLVLLALITVAPAAQAADKRATTEELPPALRSLGFEPERVVSVSRARQVRGNWFLNLPVDNLLLTAQGVGSLDVQIVTPRISVRLRVGR